MSLIEHLVERALDGGRAIAPVLAEPFAATRSEPDAALGFEEIHVEVPARDPSGATSSSPTLTRRVSHVASERASTRRELASSPDPVVGATSLREPSRSPSSNGAALVRPRASVADDAASSVRASGTSSSPGQRRASIGFESSPSASAIGPIAVGPIHVGVGPVVASPSVAAAIQSRQSIQPSQPSQQIMPIMARESSRGVAESPVVAAAASARIESLVTTASSSTRRDAAEAGPTLRISIGRVIVRAEAPAAPPRSASTQDRSTTSLSDYLAKRERGER
ncbi:hypothetical protein ACNOYE_00125 [Nannocystaceae bacterium ST9]